MTTTERYNELKAAARYQNTIVLMRCGDFYETYDADAKVCNEVLGLMLTLTQRNGKAQLLTGFPAHKREDYTAKLVRAGWRVAVCDDTIDNKPSNNNSNNSKTTTTMEEFYQTQRTCNVYMFNTEMQALVEVKPLRQHISIDTGRVKHEWQVADTDQVMKTEYNPQEPTVIPICYKTPDDFEQGKPMTIEELFWRRNADNVCGELLMKQHCRRCHDDNDEKGPYIWAFVKGKAAKWYFNDHIDTITIENSVATADAELPVVYYDAEEVYKYNDWTEVKMDGTKVKHEGVYNRLRLEPDQEALADKLQQVIDECKAAGMDIYFNFCSYDLNAVNVRHIERLEYGPSCDEEKEQAYQFDDSRVARVFKNVGDMNTEDSEVKFVIKKQ